MSFTVVVRQGTGGERVYQTLDEVRKNAPKLMAMKTRGSNEAHKYIDVYIGAFSYTKKPAYRIQFGGFMSTDPNDLIMEKFSNGRWNTIGWIQDKRWYSKANGKSKKL